MTQKNDLFAPDNFHEFLSYLRKKYLFDQYRERMDLPLFRMKHHYLFTGKKGVGKMTAARELFDILQENGFTGRFECCDAITLLDTTSGYSPNLTDYIEENSNNFLYFYNAEAFMLKGAIGSLSGMEVLANKLSTSQDTVVVLSGRKGQLTEMVNLCETARELFYTQFHFEDIPPEQLYAVALSRLRDSGYVVAPEAGDKLLALFAYVYNMRGKSFNNIYYVYKVISERIIPAHVQRVVDQKLLAEEQINRITPEDIPEIEKRDPTAALKRLQSMIGLSEVKQSILHHTSLVKLNRMRAEKGYYNRMPPMHMVFTGNPGTGKTTIAKYLGDIYRGIGALSSGHLVETDRSKLVGQYLGETEKNTLNAIERASGGVLFIDEAYNLFVEDQDRRDFGHRVIETLLTYLSLDDSDMIVILAGYTNEMERLLESNPGLKSRFPYIFRFGDYTPDQLMKIGEKVLEKEQYRLTPDAKKALSQYVMEEYNHKDEHFGNGRFITRLLTSHIIPALSSRITALPPDMVTVEAMNTIETEDIPLSKRAKVHRHQADETILASSLEQLDKLVGLDNAKRALHNFVVISRLEYGKGTTSKHGDNLQWHFIGNTGTGKSTVAEILGNLLQGLGILKRGHFTSLNFEEIIDSNRLEIAEKTISRAADGLLFIDMDAPDLQDRSLNFFRLWITNKIREMKLNVAVVFAETGDGNEAIAKNLANNGIASFNHSIVFNDFTQEELCAVFAHLLQVEHQLVMDQDAEVEFLRFIGRMRDNARNRYQVNARTMLLLAHTVAQIAQLRIAASGELSNRVIFADVDRFEWIEDQTSGYRKVGFR